MGQTRTHIRVASAVIIRPFDVWMFVWADRQEKGFLVVTVFIRSFIRLFVAWATSSSKLNLRLSNPYFNGTYASAAAFQTLSASDRKKALFASFNKR